MAKYATLADLLDAMTLKTEVNVVAMVDNDSVAFGSPDDEFETILLELHPNELIMQALAQLGVTPEHV